MSDPYPDPVLRYDTATPWEMNRPELRKPNRHERRATKARRRKKSHSNTKRERRRG